jgi:hypothetical protein
MMRCRACDIVLDHDDNYCRKCGAPVRVIEVAPAQSRAVVRVGPSTPAVIAGAAAPLATGAAAVAAGALMRFAVKRALRGMLTAPSRPRRAETRALTPARPRPQSHAAGGAMEVTEIFWYRRIQRP